jgi:hypothetical protein
VGSGDSTLPVRDLVKDLKQVLVGGEFVRTSGVPLLREILAGGVGQRRIRRVALCLLGGVLGHRRRTTVFVPFLPFRPCGFFLRFAFRARYGRLRHRRSI